MLCSTVCHLGGWGQSTLPGRLFAQALHPGHNFWGGLWQVLQHGNLAKFWPNVQELKPRIEAFVRCVQPIVLGAGPKQGPSSEQLAVSDIESFTQRECLTPNATVCVSLIDAHPQHGKDLGALLLVARRELEQENLSCAGEQFRAACRRRLSQHCV